MKAHRLWMFAGASTLAIVTAATPALAQSTPETASETVEEIVVTAQKREQALQKVASSVTALSSQTLATAGVVDMKGVANLVPSLKAVENNTPINQSYRIRGIGSDPNIPTFEPDVGLFIDGVYMPRSGLGVDDLVDISRIEVLEGPQSTLYGKNVTAGVINVVTKGPAESFEARLGVTASQIEGGRDANALRVEGSVSGPLTDKIRGRLSGVSYSQDPTYENLQPGEEDTNNMHRYAVRAEIEADLGENTTLRLAGARTEVFDTNATNPDLFIYTTIPTPTPHPNAPAALIGALGPMFGLSACPDNDPNNRVTCTTDPLRSSGFSNIVSATLNSEIGGNTLTSITAWSDYKNHLEFPGDIAQLLLPVVTFNDTQRGETFTQEIRLTSPTGEKLEWLAGAYYMKSDFARGDDGKTPTFVMGAAAPFIPLSATLPPAIKLGQPGDLGFLNSTAQSEYVAVFGQATWHFNEQFALTAGLRWQTESKQAQIDNSSVISPLNPMGINLISAVLTPTSVNAEFENSTDDLTWNLTGEYHPNPDSMLYATWSRGGKSGGVNIGFGNAPIAARPFGEEQVDNYEVGAKTDLLDKRVRLSAAAFHTIYTDYQNAGFVGLQFLVNNAERVVVNGASANGAFALGHGLSATGAVTWLDAKYDKYTGGACHYPTFLPACDLSGQTLPHSPSWRTNLGLAYKRETDFGSLYGRVDWSWSSSYLTNTNLDPRSEQEAFSLVNARIGIRTGQDFDVSLFANNLFNQTFSVVDGVTTLFGTDPAYQRYLNTPRQIGVTVTKQF